jgi:hypothetical protein
MPYNAFNELKERQTKSKQAKKTKESTSPKEEAKSKVSKNAIDRSTMQSSHSR